VNFEVNFTESVVVPLPAVALLGAGVDNGVVMLPVITLLDLILSSVMHRLQKNERLVYWIIC
jgi:hypothetical protein